MGRRTKVDSFKNMHLETGKRIDEDYLDQQDSKTQFWAVIPAGGSGTRLWPLSRSRTPKFLLSLIGDRRSLIQQTVDRLRFVCQPEHTLIMCGPPHATQIAHQLEELESGQILIEPEPKGTCSAIALAAALIERRSPDAVMGSFPADHAVYDVPAFQDALRTAVQSAAENWLVTIGCRPSRPETGYGYIALTDTVVTKTEHGVALKADGFVEKPDVETATRYVASNQFLWNSGMFVWRVSTFMEELRRYQPAIADRVSQIADAWGTAEQSSILHEIWPCLPDLSVDTGLMELSQRVAVVPAEMGWSDIGDWHGLTSLLEHDELGNCSRGDTINIGSVNSLVWSDTQRVISIIGLDNIVVVDTPDALLVADRTQAQLVRTTVNKLKEQNRPHLC
jgi:mannose-1-phosphate guanylyltransferase